ncbi:MAG TPA: NHL repeat-containing protein [Bryobacteraceae bacterium]
MASSRLGIAALGVMGGCLAQAQEYLISTYAGGAPPPTPVAGLSASIGSPLAIATEAGVNVYFASDNCVFKLDQKGVLTRVAGNSRWGYSGDGGPATRAQIRPTGVAVDGGGNLYIADGANRRVRKVSPAGIITTIAGTGTQGYSGDGGPATSAQLNLPSAVAVDGAGNLYIADSSCIEDSPCVRKVSPTGIITTIAGGGSSYPGDGASATSAELRDPSGVAVDGAGNLYIAERGGNRVRKVSPAGIISTAAGYGTAGFSGDGGPATSAELFLPSGVAVDGAGNLYIAESGRVRRVSAAGIITTVAGGGTQRPGDGGPDTSALIVPSGVAVDGAGNLYIATGNFQYRVRKVSPAGIITTVAGNGTYSYSGDGGAATSAQLNTPSSAAVDGAGNLYIADSGNYRVRKVSPAGIITTVAGNGSPGYSGDGGPATTAQLWPLRVAVDGAGNLYIAGGGRVRKVSLEGTISTVAGNGSPGYSGDGGPATSAQIGAGSVAVDGAGNLYIADSRVRRVSPAGIITTVAGNGTFGFSGDGGPATSAQIFPSSVAVDGAGNLYIADSQNNRVRKVSPAGIITTVAGSGTPPPRGRYTSYSGDGGPATSAELDHPSGIAVDDAGNLYIADFSNRRVRKVSPAGIITTIAGNGMNGYSGDGGPATGAQLGNPSDVAVDSAGRVFVTDSNGVEYGNNAILLLTPVAPTRDR